MAGIVEILTNQIFQYAVGLVLVAYLFYEMGFRYSSKPKNVNRAELIKKKMVQTLEMNKTKTIYLRQKGNTIGMIRNIGFYVIDEKKVYAMLFNPRWFGKVPKFWAKEIFLVSEDYLERPENGRYDEYLEYVEKNSEGGMTYIPKISRILNKNNPKGFKMMSPLKNLTLEKDFFVDVYFNIHINLLDKPAMYFLQTKLLADESELSSSVYVAQALRLSTVDFTKVWTPPEQISDQEKLEKGKEK